jgi:hypothetical protein
LVEQRVRGRLAYLIKTTGKIDPQKRWVWAFRFGSPSTTGSATWLTATTLRKC